MEQGEYAPIREELTALHQKYPENLRINQLYFACRYYLASTDEDLQDIEREIAALPECDRMESVVQCILATIYERTDRAKEALAIYDDITLNSTHGLVLLYIKEKFENRDDEDSQLIAAQAAVKLGSPSDETEEDEDEETEAETEADD